ncbi:FlgO family outer membrane protein [Elusimicrobiota bacterium]
MKTTFRAVALAVVTLALAAPASAGPLKRLAKKVRKGLKGQDNPKIAVLAFPYHDGRMSSGSTIVSERLTTYLAEGGDVEVIERKLLTKVLDEMKLESSGLIDRETTNRLGKVLGVGAILTGTLNDLGKGRTEVNARLIETQTGKIMVAGMTKIKRTWKDAPVTVRPPGPGPDRPDPKPGGGEFLGEALVQLSILLDTSNSMDGLISQAKTQLWRIVNDVASAEKGEKPPRLQVALYEYGNSRLSAQGNYIRRVLPLTSDLDKLSEQLFALRTSGGSEFAGAVIDDSVAGLEWAPQKDVYKAIFIAGNEPFTQGPVDFRDAVARAKGKAVFVNTIFCGDRQQGISGQWKAGADLGGGEYLNIDQDRTVVAIRAPQDDEIERLGRELNQTYIPYGSRGRSSMMRQEAQDKEAMGLSGGGAAVQRALFKAKKQYNAGAASWDAVTLVEKGEKSVDELKPEELPADLRNKSPKARRKIIEGRVRKRKEIQQRIQTLSKERKGYVVEERRKQAEAGAEMTLDQAVIRAVREQAATRGFEFKE